MNYTYFDKIKKISQHQILINIKKKQDSKNKLEVTKMNLSNTDIENYHMSWATADFLLIFSTLEAIIA